MACESREPLLVAGACGPTTSAGLNPRPHYSLTVLGSVAATLPSPPLLPLVIQYRFPNPRIFATPPPPASSSVLHADVAYHRVRQQLAARGLGLLGYAAGPELTGPSYGARANYDRVLQVGVGGGDGAGCVWDGGACVCAWVDVRVCVRVCVCVCVC